TWKLSDRRKNRSFRERRVGKIVRATAADGGLAASCQAAIGTTHPGGLPMRRYWLFALLLAAFVPSVAAAADRPNIIVILAHDMGFSDLGCYGSEIATPNLDKLAAGGVRFTQFYNTARCCPTRASLLTGLYSHQAGMGHMTEDKNNDGYR